MIPNQKMFVDEFLLPFLKKIFQTTSVRQIFLIPGNWNLGYPCLFREPIEGIIDLSQNIYRLRNGYELIGYPYVPPTPFRPKDYEKMDDPEAPCLPRRIHPIFELQNSQIASFPLIPILILKNGEQFEKI